MVVMLLGPFARFAQGRNNRIIFYSASELHPKDNIALDASRILRVYKHNDQYYVVYQTDNEDYYRPFLTVLPKNAEELDKLVYRKRRVRCIDDDCPKECLVDPYYDPACSDYVVVETEDVVLWERPNVYIGGIVEMEVTPRDLIRWHAVTFRNVDVVVRGLAEWDGSGWFGLSGRREHPEGNVERMVDLREPFSRLALLTNAKLVSSDWDGYYEEKPESIVVELAFHRPGSESIYHVYKKLGTLEEAKRFYEELKELFTAGEWIEERKEKGSEEEKTEKGKEKTKEELIKELLAKLPYWADAAYIREECWMGEEGECVTEVYPAKRSKYGNGWYFSKSWRTIYVRDAEKIGIGIVVLRDGKIMKVEEKKNGHSKYITLIPTK